MPTVEDDTREFRITVLQELVEAEGRAAAPAPELADANRYKVLFYGAAGTAGILALTLVLVLLTGGGGGKSSKSTTPTTAKPVTVATTPGYITTTISMIDSHINQGVDANSRVTFTRADGSVVVENVLDVAVKHSGGSLTVPASLDVNVAPGDDAKIRSVPIKDLYMRVGNAPEATTAPTAPPTTQPPASAPAPATTPPSS